MSLRQIPGIPGSAVHLFLVVRAATPCLFCTRMTSCPILYSASLCSKLWNYLLHITLKLWQFLNLTSVLICQALHYEIGQKSLSKNLDITRSYERLLSGLFMFVYFSLYRVVLCWFTVCLLTPCKVNKVECIYCIYTPHDTSWFYLATVDYESNEIVPVPFCLIRLPTRVP